MEPSSQVLVNVPDFDLRGGVVGYYSALQPRFAPGISLFIAGRRHNQRRGFSHVYAVLKDYFRFIRVLCKGRAQLVHLNPSVARTALLRDAVFCTITMLLRKKSLVFFHGWNANDEALLRRLWPVYRRADGFVVLAKQFEVKIRALGYTGPIYRETTVFDDRAVGPAVQPEKRDCNRFNLLFLARVVKEKGIYEALRAYASARKQCPTARLVVAGDGPELGAAKRFTEENGIPDVTFTGYIGGNVKTSAFEAADCYLLPTYHEGLPGSVVEAMAHGLPIITRPVGGLKDFFEDGKMGFLEETLDPERFAEHILRLAENPSLSSGISAYNRRYALEHFAPSCAAARLQAIYRELLLR